MKKLETNKPNIFQIFSIPFLFVQYLFSFALAASLKAFFRPEQNQRLRSLKQEEEEIDPVVMDVVNGLDHKHDPRMDVHRV